MNFRSMDEIDLKLRLLSGDPIQLDNLIIRPYSLKEIKEYGYTNYMNTLQWLSLTVDDFITSTTNLEERILFETERSRLKTFDFFTTFGSDQMKDVLLHTLAMILDTGDVRLLEENVVAIDFEKIGLVMEDEDGYMVVDRTKLETMPEDKIRLVHRDNFDELIRIVKFQNFLSTVKGREFNPANEEARKLAEQMERNRQRVEAKKKAQQKNEKGEDEETDIADIISAVTAKSNSINKFNVWDLSLYELYDEYSRLEVIDSYEFGVRAMMAGAKEIDLKHWSSKL